MVDLLLRRDRISEANNIIAARLGPFASIDVHGGAVYGDLVESFDSVCLLQYRRKDNQIPGAEPTDPYWQIVTADLDMHTERDLLKHGSLDEEQYRSFCIVPSDILIPVSAEKKPKRRTVLVEKPNDPTQVIPDQSDG